MSAAILQYLKANGEGLDIDIAKALDKLQGLLVKQQA